MNKFSPLFICLLSLILVSCSESQTSENIVTDRYVIFPNETDVSFRYPHQKRFTPTQKEAEQVLQGLNQLCEKHKGELLNFKDYKIQLVGYLNEQDQKIVWVNSTCDDVAGQGRDWRKEVILVKGGGNCYFNLEVNLVSGEVFNFSINSKK